jgi:hypothetical protein
MVARVSTEKLVRAAISPEPDPTDSDDVAIALETARALEIRGDNGEAARWLRRAADEAEKEGNDVRVVMFARAAADLSSTITGAEPRSIQPPPPKPAPWSVAVSPPGNDSFSPPPPPARTSAQPLLYRASTPPPTARASAPPVAPRASAVPPPVSVRASAPPVPPRSSSVPFSSRTTSRSSAPVPPPPRAATSIAPSIHAQPAPADALSIRVSVERSATDGTVFVVKRLQPQERPPAGTLEARLVFTGAEQ